MKSSLTDFASHPEIPTASVKIIIWQVGTGMHSNAVDIVLWYQ